MHHPALNGLNPPQRQAVLHTEGPLLVLAGAGSGKTRVIVEKIAHLIQTGRYPAKRIAAITFTNKSAREMRERVAKRIRGDAAQEAGVGVAGGDGVVEVDQCQIHRCSRFRSVSRKRRARLQRTGMPGCAP